MTGLNVCHTHGGANPVAKEAGLRRAAEAKAEAKAMKLVERYEAKLDPNIDFIEQYRKVLLTSLAWVDICQQQLEDLTSVDFTTKEGDRKLDARIALWERALDRAEKFLTNAQHLNLDERSLRIKEAQNNELATLWRAWATDLLDEISDRISDLPGGTAALADLTDIATRLGKKHLP